MPPPIATNPPTLAQPPVPFSPVAEASASGSGIYELVYYNPSGTRSQLTNGEAGTQTSVGLIKVSAAIVPTPGTSKATLGTFTLPAGALSAVGKGIRVRAYYIAAANANSKVVAIDFGGQTSVVTVTSTTSSDVFMLQLDVIKSGASTQQLFGTALATAAIVPKYTAGTQTDTAAIVVNITSTTASGAADITLEGFTVEALN